jgi:hypothetical protein
MCMNKASIGTSIAEKHFEYETQSVESIPVGEKNVPQKWLSCYGIRAGHIGGITSSIDLPRNGSRISMYALSDLGSIYVSLDL